jgi:hypothetical protein
MVFFQIGRDILQRHVGQQLAAVPGAQIAMPNAARKRQSSTGLVRLMVMASARFFDCTGPNSCRRNPASERRRPLPGWSMPLSTILWMVLMPNQSALPRIRNQWLRRCSIWARQAMLVHLRKSFCHARGSLQDGHALRQPHVSPGLEHRFQLGNDLAAADDFDAVPGPMRRKLRMLPAWWAVTRRMVAPDSGTGSTIHHRGDVAGAAYLPLDAGHRGLGRRPLGLDGDLPAVVVGRGAHAPFSGRPSLRPRHRRWDSPHRQQSVDQICGVSSTSR